MTSESDWIFWVSLAVGAFVLIMALVLMMARLYRKVEQGKAMIINTRNHLKSYRFPRLL